ncbi:MAG: S9 family peptidase [Thermogemmatispora sp.]|uniref:Peptidase n=1 Tax=Thermogemmatispora aurantia TaxID=2045279 RepID=A0A5J4K6F4_9CHLR|nr:MULTISPECIES: S9 family peptidase [Thermogemmatispora]MBE3565199.1 S9 family peptidase [Thermogemmatispora sp.]GER81726.1 peptidase [Thermogemmatispora aurantia]
MSNEVSQQAGPAAAPASRQPQSRRLIGPRESVHLRELEEFDLTPDGRRAAFVIREPVPGLPRLSRRIWLQEISTSAGPEPHPLAAGLDASEQYSPRWSPDGRLLAFLAKEKEERSGDRERLALFVMTAEGGVARRLCSLPGGLSDLAWSPDGTRLAFLGYEQPEPQSDPRVFGHEAERCQRLWTVYLDEGVPRPVTPEGLAVWEYCWSPDGRRFAVYFSAGPELTTWYRGQIGVVEAGGGPVRQLTSLEHQASGLAWSPDGTRLAFVSGEWSDVIRGAGDLYVVPVEGGPVRNLTPGAEVSVAWCRWFPDGRRLLYTAWSGLSQQVGILDEASGRRQVVEAGVVLREGWPCLATTPDLRCFLTTRSSPEQPPDLYYAELAQEDQSDPGQEAQSGLTWRRLTRLNPLAEETWLLPQSRRLSYRSVDEWEIEALFTPPLVRRGQGAPPLVVWVHGGPTGAFLEGFEDGWSLLLASAGYAVLRPNVRGSLGRGRAFAEAVVGDMGGKDLQDVLHGIDALVERGLVDGQRLAIVGWSYGGFMAAWAVTQTQRFRAAVMGAGICDWHGFHAQTNIPDFDVRFLQADPLTQPEVYRARSPLTYAAQVTTPTLILHGAEDDCVPVSQAHAFYRALRERGVPTELVIYPREGHGLRELAHQCDRHERILAWLDRYLWG